MRYRFVASILLDMIWGGLYVVCHDFSHVYRCLDFSFETIAFMCGDMVRALAWSVVIGIVC